MVRRQPLIQRNDVYRDDRDCVRQSRGLKAVASSFVMVDYIEVALALSFPECQPLNNDVLAAVEAYVQPQGSSFSRRRFEGDDLSTGTDKLREKKRVEAMMSADIEHGHAGADESANECALGQLESTVNHGGAHVIASRKKPGAGGQAHGKGNAGEKADPSAVEGPRLFMPGLSQKSPSARPYCRGSGLPKRRHEGRSTSDRTQKSLGRLRRPAHSSLGCASGSVATNICGRQSHTSTNSPASYRLTRQE